MKIVIEGSKEEIEAILVKITQPAEPVKPAEPVQAPIKAWWELTKIIC